MASIKVNLEKVSATGKVIPNEGASFSLSPETIKRLTVLPDRMLTERYPHFTTFKESPATDDSHFHRAVAMIARGENNKRMFGERNYNALYFVELGRSWVAFAYREDIDEAGNITPWHGEFFRLSGKALSIVHRHY